ncbi:MAG: GxxExxY protein [Phycisphaerales bacterium]|nr:GxxExxY protein [Phycisphaerales bacterium]
MRGLTEQVIGSAIEVHRELGPGLLESAYCTCLAREFDLRGIKYAREVKLPVVYKGVESDCGYRMDFVVEGRIVVEVKAVEKLAGIHEAQLLTYLRLSKLRVGLLINFNAPTIRNNYIRRVL